MNYQTPAEMWDHIRVLEDAISNLDTQKERLENKQLELKKELSAVRILFELKYNNDPDYKVPQPRLEEVADPVGDEEYPVIDLTKRPAGSVYDPKLGAYIFQKTVERDGGK